MHDIDAATDGPATNFLLMPLSLLLLMLLIVLVQVIKLICFYSLLLFLGRRLAATAKTPPRFSLSFFLSLSLFTYLHLSLSLARSLSIHL
jgi:hypothetical protein